MSRRLPYVFARGTLVAATLLAPVAAASQSVGKSAAAALRVPELRFHPPAPEVHEILGVPVLFLQEPTVPLVNVLARFRGGFARLGRDAYGAGTALPALLRYGGTATMTPDSLDRVLEYYALQTSFGGGGEAVSSTLNTLTQHLDEALGIWGEMLRQPRFDDREVEVWRGRELESVRRRPDDPQRLAFSEFNRLLYGDHPIGWEMEERDLAPELVAPERLRALHRRIVCPGNLVLGVTGNLPWSEMEPRLRRLLDGWPACGEPLPPSPIPDIRREAGVFLIPKDLDQSVLVMAHPTPVRLGEDAAYFSVQIGNAILGAGGFSSRILSRVRTEEGYAYSAASLWTTPRRYDGIVGAVTRTRPENTVPALRLILDIMRDMKESVPTQDEVHTAVDQIVNGFVFNFETPSQIVSRRMFYLAQDLPSDWLERYLQGVQRVTPASVRRVFARNLRPEDMTILVVGDPDRIGLEDLESLGHVTVLEVTDGRPARSSGGRDP